MPKGVSLPMDVQASQTLISVKANSYVVYNRSPSNLFLELPRFCGLMAAGYDAMDSVSVARACHLLSNSAGQRYPRTEWRRRRL